MANRKTVTQHLKEAARDIAAGERHYRAAADHIAAAQKEGATQRQIAEALAKSAAWVNELLKWRAGGCKGNSPFGASHAKAKAARRVQRAKRSSTKPAADQEDADALPNKVKLNGKDLNVDDLSPAAQEQLAKKLAADGDDEPADDNGDASAVDGDETEHLTSADWLQLFKIACDDYLPKLNTADLKVAVGYVESAASDRIGYMTAPAEDQQVPVETSQDQPAVSKPRRGRKKKAGNGDVAQPAPTVDGRAPVETNQDQPPAGNGVDVQAISRGCEGAHGAT